MVQALIIERRLFYANLILVVYTKDYISVEEVYIQVEEYPYVCSQVKLHQI